MLYRLALLILSVNTLLWAEAEPRWKPVRDEVYLQEIGTKIPWETPVLSVGVLEGAAYVGTKDGVYRVGEDQTLSPMEASPIDRIERLETAGGALWAFGLNALHRFDGAEWSEVAQGKFEDLCVYVGDVIVASEDSLFLFKEGVLEAYPNSAPAKFKIQALDVYAETIYCQGIDRIFTFDGLKYDSEGTIDFGAFSSKDLRDVLSMGDKLIVACHQGLGILRGASATQFLGSDGLPWEETLNLEGGFAGDFWIGTTKGAIRVLPDGATHYFMANRWLPNDHVNAIHAEPVERHGVAAGTVYIATDGGLAIIKYEPYTLEKKASYYERHLVEWGQKRMAFTHILEWDGAANAWMREVSDNDVGWSTHYWAAQAFKFAATGDETAKKEAIAGFNALKWSEEVTTIDGFPARAIWAVGETGHKAQGGSGGFPAEWHPAEDTRWEWKADTSSDETDAQVYYAAIFYERVADEKLKEQVREHLNRVMGHIVDNGYVLRDLDGKATKWARWDKEYLQGMEGFYARGLNGLEILNYMRTAYTITGNEKFYTALKELISWGYPEEVIRQKLVAPEPFIFHSDDRLAFYTYYTLLQYETDSRLRSLYMRSMERSWEIERIERNPWFNFIYGELTGNPCEIPESVEHLRAWPLDLVAHSYNFEHRRDIQPPEGTLPYCNVEMSISPRERGAHRWTANAGELSGGAGGHVVEDPSGWLDAYWMARYYGMILPPETKDPGLLTVEDTHRQLGATPYDGPEMPWVLE